MIMALGRLFDGEKKGLIVPFSLIHPTTCVSYVSTIMCLIRTRTRRSVLVFVLGHRCKAFLTITHNRGSVAGYWLTDLHVILDWAGDFALGIAIHGSMAV